jgi:hypothetical protein
LGPSSPRVIPHDKYTIARGKTMVLPLHYSSFPEKPPLVDPCPAYKREMLVSEQGGIEEQKDISKRNLRRPDVFKRRQTDKNEQEEERR